MRARTLGLIVAVLCLFMTGCEKRELVEQQRQATADTAATMFEAATAIEQGADPKAPSTAIKLGAAAIIESQGRSYPPAEAFLREVRSKQPVPEK